LSESDTLAHKSVDGKSKLFQRAEMPFGFLRPLPAALREELKKRLSTDADIPKEAPTFAFPSKPHRWSSLPTGELNQNQQLVRIETPVDSGPAVVSAILSGREMGGICLVFDRCDELIRANLQAWHVTLGQLPVVITDPATAVDRLYCIPSSELCSSEFTSPIPDDYEPSPSRLMTALWHIGEQPETDGFMVLCLWAASPEKLEEDMLSGIESGRRVLDSKPIDCACRIYFC